MSLEAIRKSILGEAESKAKAEQSEASSEAEKMVKEAESKAKALLKQAEAEAKAEETRMRNEAAAGLETERNAMVIEAKGKVVEKVLDSVKGQVERNIKSSNMDRMFKAAMKQFSELGDADDAVIRTSKKNAALMKGRHNVEYTNVDGFVISTDDGKISLNATVDALVEGKTEEIRKIVSEEVFTGSQEKKIAKATSSMAKKSGKVIAKKMPKKAKAAPKKKAVKARKSGKTSKKRR